MRTSVLILALAVTACRASDTDDGMLTLEEAVAECEDISACFEAGCADERATAAAWLAQQPMWEEDCPAQCEDDPDPGLCIEDCFVWREGIEAEWEAQNEINFAAMRECEATCYERPEVGDLACDSTNPDLAWWCPIMAAIDRFEWGGMTCEQHLLLYW